MSLAATRSLCLEPKLRLTGTSLRHQSHVVGLVSRDRGSRGDILRGLSKTGVKMFQSILGGLLARLGAAIALLGGSGYITYNFVLSSPPGVSVSGTVFVGTPGPIAGASLSTLLVVAAAFVGFKLLKRRSLAA